MFEKWESRSYPQVDAAIIHKHAFQWWHGAGFRLTETGPGQFVGVSASRWGLEREVNLNIKDVSGTAVVELRMKANVTTEGVLAGGLALVLLWPVAIVGGAYSYAQYEKDALDLMSAFWNSVAAVANTAPTDQQEEVIHTTAVPKDEVAIASPGVTPQPGGAAAAPMSKEEKLSLLEDRLARGEITEETFREIKQRLQS
jgi:hypothetical protein